MLGGALPEETPELMRQAGETGALTADATARETAGAKENSGAKEPAAGSSLTDWAFGLGKRFITFLRGLWDVIWNGPEKTESPGTGEQTGEARSDTVSAKQAESVGDIEKLAEVAADAGAKGMAWIAYTTSGEAKSPIIKFLGDEVGGSWVIECDTQERKYKYNNV